MHLRRAKGAGLLGRQGLRAEGRSFRENSTFKPPATNANSTGSGAYILGQRPQSPGRQGTVVQEEPVLLSFCPPLLPPGAAQHFWLQKEEQLTGSSQQSLWPRDTNPSFPSSSRKS